MRASAEGRKQTGRGARLEARVSRAHKALFKKAAELQGCSLTDFMVNSAVEVANRTVRESEFMDFTQRDRMAFVQALLQAPASPNAKLRSAAERYAKLFPAR